MGERPEVPRRRRPDVADAPPPAAREPLEIGRRTSNSVHTDTSKFGCLYVPLSLVYSDLFQLGRGAGPEDIICLQTVAKCAHYM